MTAASPLRRLRDGRHYPAWLAALATASFIAAALLALYFPGPIPFSLCFACLIWAACLLHLALARFASSRLTLANYVAAEIAFIVGHIAFAFFLFLN